MADNNGWILLHRSLMDNDVWGKYETEEHNYMFGPAFAFVDLLMRVNHTTTRKGKRGTTYISYKSLSEKWGVCEETVSNYVGELEKLGLIKLKRREGKSPIITVVNYEKYQDSRTKDHPTRSGGQSGGQSVGESVSESVRTKNVKRIKKNEKEDYAHLTFSEGEYEAYVARTGGRV